MLATALAADFPVNGPEGKGHRRRVSLPHSPSGHDGLGKEAPRRGRDIVLTFVLAASDSSTSTRGAPSLRHRPDG
ncbi:hypothetical protein VUR80DRAFT_1995 [Thermomyces stellatus]